MVTSQINRMTRKSEKMTLTSNQPKRHRRSLLMVDARDEPDLFTCSHMHRVVTALKNSKVPQPDATQTRLLYIQVPNFRSSKDNFQEIEDLLINHLGLHQNCITEENQICYSQSLFRDKHLISGKRVSLQKPP